MSDDARLPAFQFYPADWQGNANLRRCTHEERGIWMDVLCILHDSQRGEYGMVRWTIADIANAVGTTPKKLHGLVAKGVLKGSDTDVAAFVYRPRSARQDGEPVTLIAAQKGPLWYSSRMVKDAYVRHRRGAQTRFESSPHTSPKASPKASPNTSPKPSPKVVLSDGPSSSSSSTDKELLRSSVERVFDGLWKTWPDVARKRHSRAKVQEAIRKQLKLGADPDAIIAAGKAHVAERTRDGRDELVKGLVPWLAGGLWRNWAPNGGEPEKVDWGLRMRVWRESAGEEWPERWGPKPDELGFLGPRDEDDAPTTQTREPST